MIGVEVKKIYDVKTSFSAVLQEAAKSKEIICQNGKSLNSNMVSIISTSMIDEILQAYKFKPEILYDLEGSKQHEILLHEIGVFAYADTREEAEERLLDLVEDTVESYLENAETYTKFENHRKKYPYILRLSHCKDREDLRRTILHGDM